MKKTIKLFTIGALISVIAITSSAAETKTETEKTSTITTTISGGSAKGTSSGSTEIKSYPMIPSFRPYTRGDNYKLNDSEKK